VLSHELGDEYILPVRDIHADLQDAIEIDLVDGDHDPAFHVFAADHAERRWSRGVRTFDRGQVRPGEDGIAGEAEHMVGSPMTHGQDEVGRIGLGDVLDPPTNKARSQLIGN